MRRTILLILVLTLACAGEAAASGTDVLRDCTDDGRLQGTYTQQELRQAIATIPSDVDEYTDCRDVIKAAQLSGAGDTGGDDGPAGGTGTDDGGTDGGATNGGGGTGTGTGTGTGSGPQTATGTGGGTAAAGEQGANPATGSTAGYFGGFSGFERDPLRAASDAEQQAIEDAIASRPAAVARGEGPFADADLPTPLWIVLALGAAGLIALAASDLRRRVVARRAV